MVVMEVTILTVYIILIQQNTSILLKLYSITECASFSFFVICLGHQVPRATIGLVTSRADIASLLKLGQSVSQSVSLVALMQIALYVGTFMDLSSSSSNRS
jgi:hypothetical protein